MFQPGDKVVYNNDGVCEVVAIADRTVPGGSGTRAFYTLKPLYQDYVIYTPVDSDRLFVRPVVSREEALAIIDSIPDHADDEAYSHVRKEALAQYQKHIRSHDLGKLVQLTMGIYQKRILAEQKKHAFGGVDEQYMKRAEELLFGELAVALDIDRDSVPAFIAARLGGDENGI